MRHASMPLLAAGLLLAGCETTAVAPHKAGATLDLDERRLWLQVAAEEDSLTSSGFVAKLPAIEIYLNRLVQRLHPEPIVGGAPLRVRVLADPSFNAFAMANGAIFIHTGLLARVQNEAQLATILGHELTHTVNRHSLNSYRSLKNHTAFITTMTVGTGGLAGLLASFGAASSYTGYSQDLEREADSAGFQSLLAAGYDPRQSVEVFQILRTESLRRKDKEPFFFASHPRLQERVTNFESFVAGLPAERRTQGRTGTAEYEAILPDILAINADAALSAGDLDFARDSAARLRSLRAEDPRGPYLLAEVHRRRGTADDHTQALRLYREAAARDDAPAEAHRGLGLELLRLGTKTDAAAAFRHYLQLKPEARDSAHIQEFIRQCEATP